MREKQSFGMTFVFISQHFASFVSPLWLILLLWARIFTQQLRRKENLLEIETSKPGRRSIW